MRKEEDRGQRAGVRRQRTEDRGQRTKDRGQRTDFCLGSENLKEDRG